MMEKVYKDNEFMEYPKGERVYNSSVEAIPIELYEQVKGERDVAIEQLKALNIELFEKPYLKAIPIEWLERIIKELTSSYKYDTCAELIRALINDWEKENEEKENEID